MSGPLDPQEEKIVAKRLQERRVLIAEGMLKDPDDDEEAERKIRLAVRNGADDGRT